MRLLFTLSVLLLNSVSFSQSLEGEWKGSYDNYDHTTHKIILHFTLNKDQSYTVYSYTPDLKGDGSESVLICSVSFKKTGRNSFRLEETALVKPVGAKGGCKQRFDLRLVKYKKEQKLEGSWRSADKECDAGFGAIRFKRGA